MAVRGLRIRWSYSPGFDGNLQLPSKSLRVALANTYGDCNGNAYCNSDSDSDAYCYRGAEVYADTAAASHTAAPALRPAFTQFVRGLAKQFASPRKAVSCLCQSASSQKMNVERVGPTAASPPGICEALVRRRFQQKKLF
jgi:hypothetical protein